MTTKSQRALPNQQSLEAVTNLFCNITECWQEFNSSYIEQSKAFFSVNLAHLQQLYHSNNLHEYILNLNHALAQNSTLLAQYLGAGAHLAMEICHKACAASQSNLDMLRRNGFQIYDFYAKLIPTPLSLKVDEVVKSATNGNHAALHCLHTLTKGWLEVMADNVKQSRAAMLPQQPPNS